MVNGKKERIREKLTSSLQELLSHLEDLDEQQWQATVYADQSIWSVSDLLRHLVDAERGMTELMKRIRDGAGGVPPDFDINRWNARVIQKAKEKSATQLLKELKEGRPRLLDFVDQLSEDDWHKKGRHATLRILSIEEICHLIADHEQAHVADIKRAIGIEA